MTAPTPLLWAVVYHDASTNVEHETIIEAPGERVLLAVKVDQWMIDIGVTPGHGDYWEATRSDFDDDGENRVDTVIGYKYTGDEP